VLTFNAISGIVVGDVGEFGEYTFRSSLIFFPISDD